MIFEEFLKKKKIDPVQLQIAEPGLFSEFANHFGQMGEKSFDHSKKFWFNKLRRSYHLKEEPKQVPAKEVKEINEVAKQAESLLSPSVDATVYTPRFKAAPTQTKTVEDKNIDQGKTTKPAYQPRFKAPTSDQAATKPSELSTISNEPSTATFKPRFKPGITNKPSAEEHNAQQTKTTPVNTDQLEPQTSPAVTVKPTSGYVPRFKAKINPPASSELDNQTTEIADKKEVNQENQTIQPSAPSPKPAYVPRFKAKINTTDDIQESHSDNNPKE